MTEKLEVIWSLFSSCNSDVPPVPKEKYSLNSPHFVTGVDFSLFKRGSTIL